MVMTKKLKTLQKIFQLQKKNLKILIVQIEAAENTITNDRNVARKYFATDQKPQRKTPPAF